MTLHFIEVGRSDSGGANSPLHAGYEFWLDVIAPDAYWAPIYPQGEAVRLVQVTDGPGLVTAGSRPSGFNPNSVSSQEPFVLTAGGTPADRDDYPRNIQMQLNVGVEGMVAVLGDDRIGPDASQRITTPATAIDCEAVFSWANPRAQPKFFLSSDPAGEDRVEVGVEGDIFDALLTASHVRMAGNDAAAQGHRNFTSTHGPGRVLLSEINFQYLGWKGINTRYNPFVPLGDRILPTTWREMAATTDSWEFLPGEELGKTGGIHYPDPPFPAGANFFPDFASVTWGFEQRAADLPVPGNTTLDCGVSMSAIRVVVSHGDQILGQMSDADLPPNTDPSAVATGNDIQNTPFIREDRLPPMRFVVYLSPFTGRGVCHSRVGTFTFDHAMPDPQLSSSNPTPAFYAGLTAVAPYSYEGNIFSTNAPPLSSSSAGVRMSIQSRILESTAGPWIPALVSQVEDPEQVWHIGYSGWQTADDTFMVGMPFPYLEPVSLADVVVDAAAQEPEPRTDYTGRAGYQMSPLAPEWRDAWAPTRATDFRTRVMFTGSHRHAPGLPTLSGLDTKSLEVSLSLHNEEAITQYTNPSFSAPPAPPFMTPFQFDGGVPSGQLNTTQFFSAKALTHTTTLGHQRPDGVEIATNTFFGIGGPGESTFTFSRAGRPGGAGNGWIGHREDFAPEYGEPFSNTNPVTIVGNQMYENITVNDVLNGFAAAGPLLEWPEFEHAKSRGGSSLGLLHKKFVGRQRGGLFISTMVDDESPVDRFVAWWTAGGVYEVERVNIITHVRFFPRNRGGSFVRTRPRFDVLFRTKAFIRVTLTKAIVTAYDIVKSDDPALPLVPQTGSRIGGVCKTQEVEATGGGFFTCRVSLEHGLTLSDEESDALLANEEVSVFRHMVPQSIFGGFGPEHMRRGGAENEVPCMKYTLRAVT